MKKFFFIGAMLFGLCFTIQNVSAQLKISSNGKVGIHLADNVEPLSYLSLGAAGGSNTRLYVYESGTASGNQFGIHSSLSWGSSNNWKYAVNGYSKGIGGYMVGIKGTAEPANTNINGDVTTYGVYGLAGGANYGKNYGVFGMLQTGDAYGAGVYGTNDGTSQPITARYAGFFRGNTYVNGNIYAASFSLTSDARLKTNITDIKADALQKVQNLHPVQFTWQQTEDISIQDSIEVRTPHFSEDVVLDNQHYGFLAQDVQKLFPELVHEDGAGYLSVNYVELIPLLVQAVQELSEEVTELKARTK